MPELRPAVYSTIYPALLRFLPDFASSVAGQTHQDFTLFLGLDEVEEAQISGLFSGVRTCCIHGQPGDGPSGLRQRAWAALLEEHDPVVLADADDIMLPDRVARSLAASARYDVCGFTMLLADSECRPLGPSLNPGPDFDPGALLPVCNFLGLSNTTWRAAALAACLPVTEHVRALDWFLAVKAMGAGLHIGFEQAPGVLYRQYPGNIASLATPFAPDVIRRQTEVVLEHFAALFSSGAVSSFPAPLAKALEKRKLEVAAFGRAIGDEAALSEYTVRLAGIPLQHLWWECVAHRQLANLWRGDGQ